MREVCRRGVVVGEVETSLTGTGGGGGGGERRRSHLDASECSCPTTLRLRRAPLTTPHFHPDRHTPRALALTVPTLL
ncbi:hypothetical protein JYU34_021151 [Plutella xylostella]|uniref:Uncharacterized protein n=1 Tax=Plutella xylostella TaxID=51655 RepID=A0ABQ7PSV8_PLUXY|nr:hypothetical protein JYU34_021151 [Plutella xylostella]